MKYKILNSSPTGIEDKLNKLKKEYNIKVLHMTMPNPVYLIVLILLENKHV